MNREVYRVEIEVGRMEGTQLPEDFIGAFVSVYLPATDIKEAIDLTEEYLLTDKYNPIETTAAYRLDLDDIDYDTDEEGYPGNKDLRNLLENGGYWYGPFNGWFSVEENEKH